MIVSRRRAVATLAAPFLVPFAARAQAPANEARSLRISIQPGMSQIPMVIMKERALVEARLQAAGLGDTRIEWSQISGGPAMNDALLSDSIDVASAGTPAFLVLAERTRTQRVAVRGVANAAMIPQMLFTRNPAVRTIADFTERDRIAVPAVRISLQSILLQMAAARLWGPEQFDRLERFTVALPHADAYAALQQGRTEINAHFSGPPLQYEQLKDQNLRMILNSNSITDGPACLNIMYAKASFREANPRSFRAIVAACDDAMAFINADHHAAAEIFIRANRWTMNPDELATIMRNPDIEFSTTPKRMQFFVEHLVRTRTLREAPASWRDLFHPEMHERPGS